jgi:protease IV
VSQKPLKAFLSKLNPLRAIGRSWLALQNWRRLRDKHLDYILFDLPASMPPLPETRGWLRRRVFGAPALSLWDFDKLLQQVADDPRPKGVILRLGEPAMLLADLQTLRGSMLRFRERGKRLVAYAQGYSLGAYYLASACDDILIQTGGDLFTLGLSQRAAFLKQTLDTIGVQIDVVAITPFKSALDSLSQSDISPEGRAQIDWLLDSRYDMLVDAIAEGRKTSADAVRQMIDTAPHLDNAAKAAGYVDGVLHEEDLAQYLGAEHLVLWKQARKKIIRKPRRSVGQKAVAIMTVEGLMITGESGSPPLDLPLPFLDAERAGDRTVVQQARELIDADEIGAVVLYIDSGGGSAVAAEAMTAALLELAKTKPLVAYMNGVAASGGYYIATAAQWIVAQPGTITGSIGVVLAKAVSQGLLAKLNVQTVEFQRGANAALLSDSAPFSDAQRAQMRASITHIYEQFIGHVARARGLTTDAVDAVGGGRVWTGAQALEHKLVDELGDLRAALAKARALANLPDDAPVVVWEGGDDPLPPLKAVDPAAALTYYAQNLRALANGRAQLLMDIRFDPRGH